MMIYVLRLGGRLCVIIKSNNIPVIVNIEQLTESKLLSLHPKCTGKVYHCLDFIYKQVFA